MEKILDHAGDGVGSRQTAVVPIFPDQKIPAQHEAAPHTRVSADGGLVRSVTPKKNDYSARVRSDAIHVCRICDTPLNGHKKHPCLEVELDHVALDHDLTTGRGVMCSRLEGRIAALVFCGTHERVTLIHSVGEYSIQLCIHRLGLVPTRIVLKCAERFNCRGEPRPGVLMQTWKAVFPGASIHICNYSHGERIYGKHMTDSLHCWIDPNTGKTMFV